MRRARPPQQAIWHCSTNSSRNQRARSSGCMTTAWTRGPQPQPLSGPSASKWMARFMVAEEATLRKQRGTKLPRRASFGWVSSCDQMVPGLECRGECRVVMLALAWWQWGVYAWTGLSTLCMTSPDPRWCGVRNVSVSFSCVGVQKCCTGCVTSSILIPRLRYPRSQNTYEPRSHRLFLSRPFILLALFIMELD